MMSQCSTVIVTKGLLTGHYKYWGHPWQQFILAVASTVCIWPRLTLNINHRSLDEYMLLSNSEPHDKAEIHYTIIPLVVHVLFVYNKSYRQLRKVTSHRIRMALSM